MALLRERVAELECFVGGTWERGDEPVAAARIARLSAIPSVTSIPIGPE
jgi:hypothetical protein